jgi:hypothetical protein
MLLATGTHLLSDLLRVNVRKSACDVVRLAFETFDTVPDFPFRVDDERGVVRGFLP